MADLWQDYTRFHKLMTDSGDMDPVYPVYRRLAGMLGLSYSQKVWLVLCHVAYYHAGSALAAFSATNGIGDAQMARLDLPCATERRGHRSPAALSAHLADIARRSREILSWYHVAAVRGRHDGGWDYLAGQLSTIHGNGRWAAYKTTEMLQQIVPVPIEAPDMGHAFSSGPRKGLALLYDDLPTGNSAEVVAHLDDLSAEVVGYLSRSSADATFATAETSLCDFHSLVAGRYYVGMDIDRMQVQIAAVPSPLTQTVMQARMLALPRRCLGELNGWDGIDTDRRHVYADTGKIVDR